MSHTKATHHTSSASQSSQKKRKLDRFIPHSVAKNLFNAPQHSQSNNYQELLESNLLQNLTPKILNFHQDTPNNENYNPNMPYCQSSSQAKPQLLPQQPYKVLPANLLKDDFYLNLLDWSESGQIGVGLQSGLYLWSGCATKVTRAHQFKKDGELICAVNFMPAASKVVMGMTKGEVAMCDLGKQELDRRRGVHLGRVGSLGCSNNLICSGGRDGYVTIWDQRQEEEIFRYRAHDQEICGLKMSPAHDMIATGGNDNKLNLFSLRKMETVAEWRQHRAAVKAIGFNPSDPSIISGGGCADRKLRIFSLNTFELLNQVDTGSQVCNLTYSSVSDQLLTSHGYSLNQLTLWKWGPQGELTRLDSVMGHKSRVLYLSGEHGGGRVVTGAGDEQLRLWKVFDEPLRQRASDLR